MKINKLGLLLVFLFNLACPMSAHALLVDLWGVTPGSWTPSDLTVNYTNNDEAPDGSGSGFHNDPGYGGQPYDAEAFYAKVDDNFLYLSMVTGFQPEGLYNGRTFYVAGDMALDVGGTRGDYEYGIRAGSTLPTPTTGGTLFQNVTDWSDVLYPSHSEAGPLQVLTYGSSVNYSSITYELWQGTHYAFEAILSLADLGLANHDGFDYDVRWTMGCGNDYVRLQGTVNTPDDFPPIPEPSSMLLLLSGLTSIGFWRRKR